MVAKKLTIPDDAPDRVQYLYNIFNGEVQETDKVQVFKNVSDWSIYDNRPDMSLDERNTAVLEKKKATLTVAGWMMLNRPDDLARMFVSLSSPERQSVIYDALHPNEKCKAVTVDDFALWVSVYIHQPMEEKPWFIRYQQDLLELPIMAQGFAHYLQNASLNEIGDNFPVVINMLRSLNLTDGLNQVLTEKAEELMAGLWAAALKDHSLDRPASLINLLESHPQLSVASVTALKQQLSECGWEDDRKKANLQRHLAAVLEHCKARDGHMLRDLPLPQLRLIQGQINSDSPVQSVFTQIIEEKQAELDEQQQQATIVQQQEAEAKQFFEQKMDELRQGDYRELVSVLLHKDVELQKVVIWHYPSGASQPVIDELLTAHPDVYADVIGVLDPSLQLALLGEQRLNQIKAQKPDILQKILSAPSIERMGINDAKVQDEIIPWMLNHYPHPLFFILGTLMTVNGNVNLKALDGMIRYGVIDKLARDFPDDMRKVELYYQTYQPGVLDYLNQQRPNWQYHYLQNEDGTLKDGITLESFAEYGLTGKQVWTLLHQQSAAGQLLLAEVLAQDQSIERVLKTLEGTEHIASLVQELVGNDAYQLSGKDLLALQQAYPEQSFAQMFTDCSQQQRQTLAEYLRKNNTVLIQVLKNLDLQGLKSIISSLEPHKASNKPIYLAILAHPANTVKLSSSIAKIPCFKQDETIQQGAAFFINKQKFYESLKLLETDKASLEESQQAIAGKLHDSLLNAGERFFGKPGEVKAPDSNQLEPFQTACAQAVSEALPEMAKQPRKWFRIPLIIRGIMGVVSVPLIVPVILTATLTEEGFTGTFFGCGNNKGMETFNKIRELLGNLSPKADIEPPKSPDL